jgi:hypothetical protein
VSDQPDSPVLVFVIGLAMAASSYGFHRLLQQIRQGNFLGPDSFQNLDRRLEGHWLFGDRENWLETQRFFWRFLLTGFKWILGFGSVVCCAVYPVIYLVRFAGR